MDPETGAIAQKEFDRAQQELDQNNVLAALACLERALSIWDDPLWHSRLGFCIAKQRGQLTKAFELCRSAIEHDPDNPLHYLYLGKVYLVAGNTFEALQAFRQGMILWGESGARADARYYRDQETSGHIFSFTRQPVEQISGNHSWSFGIEIGTVQSDTAVENKKRCRFTGTFFLCMAGLTGLEPATSSVTGWHSNQLSYNPKTSSQFNSDIYVT